MHYNFTLKLQEQLFLSQQNKYKGNNRHFPDFMYPHYVKEFQKSEKSEKSENEKIINQESSSINIYDLEKAFNLLSDEYSCDLFIKLVLFRLLGPSKVKLPLTDYSLFKDFDELKKFELPINSNVIEEHNLHNLHMFGFPIKIFYDTYGIFITFLRKQYDYATLGVRTGDIVIDGGGCYGDTALYFAHRVGSEGKVYSFEFIDKNIQCFAENLQQNPMLAKRIEIIESPLWSYSGSELFIIENGPASYCVTQEPENYTKKVCSCSIDDFVEKNKLERVDFIKLDIEGAEPEALHGAKKSIQKFKPRLAICIYHDFNHFFQIPQYLHEILPEYNFYIDHHSIHLGETVLYADVNPIYRNKLGNVVEKTCIKGDIDVI